MQPPTIRVWVWIHKWTSLVCTAFLLMLCITGLPLIFHDEIDAILNPNEWRPANPGGTLLSLDEVLSIALSQRPGEVPIYMSFDIDRPVVNVTTGPTPDAPEAQMHFASFDQTSGALVPPADVGEGVMDFILQLHTDMFLGLAGMFFLGFMGVLFALSVISGVVLYAPFMAKLDFGTIRRDKSARVKWLDYHNLLGIIATGWLLVVGLTGVINAFEHPIIDTWRENELSDLITRNETAPPAEASSSIDAAVAQAVDAAPDMQLQFIAFPGSAFSTDAHYAIFFHGRTPATKRIITPVLVNAAHGSFEGLRETPWYVTALSLSRPLHFGDYGGLFLKAVWAILDVIAIIILGSGLYLWAAKERRGEKHPITKTENHTAS